MAALLARNHSASTPKLFILLKLIIRLLPQIAPQVGRIYIAVLEKTPKSDSFCYEKNVALGHLDTPTKEHLSKVTSFYNEFFSVFWLFIFKVTVPCVTFFLGFQNRLFSTGCVLVVYF
jgi:hypothetical protein